MTFFSNNHPELKMLSVNLGSRAQKQTKQLRFKVWLLLPSHFMGATKSRSLLSHHENLRINHLKAIGKNRKTAHFCVPL